MIFTVTLNPSVDCLLRADSLAAGRTNRAFAEEISFGGKGVNVSRVLARLGVPSVALGFAAGFTGEAIAASLSGPLITPDFVRLREGVSRINFKLCAGEETELNAPGPDAAPDETEALLKKLDALREGDTLVLSGSAPASPGAGAYAAILGRVSGRGVRVVADLAGAALTACLGYRPFLIKPNRQELRELFGAAADDPPACAEKLRAAGARNVLISLGAEGAFLADETGGRFSLPAPRCETVSSFGAGDSMIAGFIAEYDATGDFRAALRFGIACGTAAASCAGLADAETAARFAAAMP